MFSFLNGNGGAEDIVDETYKINDVKGDILKTSNELHNRKKMLEFRLQRLDSVVPPETWVPDKVDRFNNNSDNNFIKVNNPVTDLKSNPFMMNKGGNNNA